MLAELQGTGFIGMWSNRKDIKDSTDYVAHLRKQIETRSDRSEPSE